MAQGAITAPWGRGPPPAIRCPPPSCPTGGRGGMLLWQRAAPKEGSRHHGNALPKEEGGAAAMATAARHRDVLGPAAAGEGQGWGQGRGHGPGTASPPDPHARGEPPSGPPSLAGPGGGKQPGGTAPARMALALDTCHVPGDLGDPGDGAGTRRRARPTSPAQARDGSPGNPRAHGRWTGHGAGSCWLSTEAQGRGSLSVAKPQH